MTEQDQIEVAALIALGPLRAAELRTLIRDVPGYPHDPIVFRDITPLLANGPAFKDVIEAFAAAAKDLD
ncbi:MAG: hypothetical protein LBB58_04960, partial [Cellulomonadaceae bacterium]|nr:hypothetical protein [Cellulomonadaceae bacterium]